MTRSQLRRSRQEKVRPAGAATQQWWQRHWPLLVAAVLVLISLYLRYVTRGMTNSDMEAKVLVWYAKLQRHGPLVGIGKDFYNYTPPYVYLLALATLTSSFLAPLTAVKIIALVFDIVCAVLVFMIVRLHRPQGYLPVFAAVAFFSAPTFLVNSAVWGQADSTFAAFMLACFYCFLVGKPLLGVVFFSVGLAIKPQGIFFSPLLLLMLLWGRMRWYHVLAIPLAYAVTMSPAVVLGRTWYEVFTAYASQADAGKALTHNAANIYVFIPREAYGWLLWPAAAGAFVIVLAWVWFTWRKTVRFDAPALTLIALVCVTIVPFFLPNMRERYYYLGDILSLVLAFMLPSFWPVPVLFQAFSMLSYSMFLWEGPRSNLQVATLLSFLTLILLLIYQVQLTTTHRIPLPADGTRSTARGRRG